MSLLAIFVLIKTYNLKTNFKKEVSLLLCFSILVTWFTSEIFISIGIIVDTLNSLLNYSKYYSDSGIFSYKILIEAESKKNLLLKIQSFFSPILNESGFFIFSIIRLIFSFLLIIFPSQLFFLIFFLFLIIKFS